MNWKIFSVTIFGASLILSGQVMAAGPGGQGGAQSRMMIPTQSQKVQANHMQERMQVRERSQSPQAPLPDQASETAVAAVNNAGMGRSTADSVKGTREHAAMQPAPESETTGLLLEPATDL